MYSVWVYIDYFYSPRQRQVGASGFFDHTLENMKKVINNTQDSEQLIVYSAHDTTVSAVISALNLTNVDCIVDYWLNGKTEVADTCIYSYPYFTSNVIFELYEDGEGDSKTHTFKVFHRSKIDFV